MIEHIAELNRVLLTAKSLSTGVGIDKLALRDGCRSITIEGRMPEHLETIEFSVELGMLAPKGKKKVNITEVGVAFLELNKDELYDLSTEQKEYLIRSFFLGGALQKHVKECLKCFVASEKEETFTWSAIDGTPFGERSWVVSHLEQLGLINCLEEHRYSVDKNYVQTVSEFINEPKGFTEEELLRWLAEKKKLGDIAEDMVLKYEITRLTKMGHIVEARCVKPVAKINTSAGYDIQSFNGKAKGMLFDRFIEVKGSGDPKLRFIWTPNEMKTAEKLKDKYWIYFQGGINKRDGTSLYKPIMLQDPFHKLEGDARVTKTSNGFVVVGSFRGELIEAKGTTGKKKPR